MAAGLVDRDDVGGQVLDDDERTALLDELLGPDPGRAPARPRRRRPWLRWLSTVGVAFVAAVCVLVGPAQTEAKADALLPIIGAVGEEAAVPESMVLLSSGYQSCLLTSVPPPGFPPVFGIGTFGPLQDPSAGRFTVRNVSTMPKIHGP